MKSKLIVACSFLFLQSLVGMSFGQPDDVYFRFDQMPAAGDTLLQNWKFHSGDDRGWANPNYNDRDWQGIDGNMYIADFVNTQQQQHIGWFRLKIKVGESMRNKIVGISCYATGATEMYFNGKLVRKLGEIDRNPSQVKVYLNVLKPTPVLLSNDSIQVLSIRFAYKPGALYVVGAFKQSLLVAGIGDTQLQIGSIYGLSEGILSMCFFLGGLNFAFFLLHLFLYFFYRREIYNIYYTFFALFGCFCWLIAGLLVLAHNLETVTLMRGIFNLFFILDPIFFALTVYSLLDYTKRKMFILLVIVSLSCLLLQFYQRDFSYALINLLFVLFSIHLFIVAYAERKHGKPGSYFILFGTGSFTLFTGLASVVVAITNNIDVYAYLVGVATAFNLTALSLIIAKRHAVTSLLLADKLEEVKTLARENESILTAQNTILEEKVTARTTELQQSLQNLRSTQTQLIHAEKMASLGELTAGIAHEIQNPLNFVNNFSDLNKELAAELEEELDAGNYDDAKAIASDIKTNEDKINHHGKRAQSIVTGMLQHSRSGKGEKQLTDINKLADEYLRLAYHGMRSKDKNFECALETFLDESIGQVNIIPQEIGRVILNLVNNAFYAVNEKAKAAKEDYKPTVTVTIKKESNSVLLKVTDNGNGIPDKIKDKIFNPFFTTKPTGQGTGLGLSLSYDIVKAHGGELKVESEEGKRTSFMFTIPS